MADTDFEQTLTDTDARTLQCEDWPGHCSTDRVLAHRGRPAPDLMCGRHAYDLAPREVT